MLPRESSPHREASQQMGVDSGAGSWEQPGSGVRLFTPKACPQGHISFHQHRPPKPPKQHCQMWTKCLNIQVSGGHFSCPGPNGSWPQHSAKCICIFRGPIISQSRHCLKTKVSSETQGNCQLLSLLCGRIRNRLLFYTWKLYIYLPEQNQNCLLEVVNDLRDWIAK